MDIKNIQSYSNLMDELKDSKKNFLLLYKSGSEQSDCALSNLHNVEISVDEINFLGADVATVRDIHENYQINSVPTLLEFENNKLLKTIKGCYEPGFFKSLFENSLYSAINKNNEKKSKRVIVYSTPTCPHCTTIKNYLKDNRITFRDIDVSRDQDMAQQMVRKSGQQGVPQVEINGRIVVGFDKPKIDKLLEIR